MAGEPGRLGKVPLVGGKVAAGLFVCMLLGFVVETQLTQFVETTLDFNQPFLLFYIVHASFAIIFPFHVLYLKYATGLPIKEQWDLLTLTIISHLGADDPSGPEKLPVRKILRLTAILTFAVTLPGLLWFASVGIASITDVTAIWNCNAFFAYIITVKLNKLPWNPYRLAAVVVASMGVLLVIYGSNPPSSSTDTPGAPPSVAPPLVGDLLTLIASFAYGLYQVLYKRIATPPPSTDVEDDTEGYSSVPYHSISSSDSEFVDSSEATGLARKKAARPLPFGLYANFWTCAIGICTLVVLWVAIPILHFTGVERYAPPKNLFTFTSIAGAATGGVAFNGCFMILLGIWGPIVVSVGSLLTIVLVLISDTIFFGAWATLTLWSMLGCAMVIGAFGMIAWNMILVKD